MRMFTCRVHFNALNDNNKVVVDIPSAEPIFTTNFNGGDAINVPNRRTFLQSFINYLSNIRFILLFTSHQSESNSLSFFLLFKNKIPNFALDAVIEATIMEKTNNTKSSQTLDSISTVKIVSEPIKSIK